ncbi:MAG: DUF1009 domain-containing protein [Erysipelotrichia bacterium]|nr:DUF1009 domain-containing protein [Erysipelotrichia bacterium]
MPSYKKSLVFCLLLSIFTGCSVKDATINNKEKQIVFKKVELKKFDLEDLFIMYAIESENQRMYYDAKEVYLKLFENTNNYEYLVKHLTLATQLKEFSLVNENASKYMMEDIKEEEIILRLYTFSLFKLQEKKKSILNAEKLISKYKNDINYELLGSIYLEDKNFQKAYESFSNAFLLNNSSNTLLTLTNIQFFSLHQKEEAIKKLENYIEQNEYNFNLSLQLLTFYEKDESKQRLTNLLKRMFVYYKNSDNQLLLNKTKTLFLKYLVNDDVNLLISFWEENGEEDDILFGREIAKQMGRIDVGQTVVVKKKAIVAIEAMEGTDRAISRGGKIARHGAVVIKMSKPSQDLRFDVPVIGPRTIKTMIRSQASCLAIEAEKTLIIDKAKCLQLANRHNITIRCI